MIVKSLKEKTWEKHEIYTFENIHKLDISWSISLSCSFVTVPELFRRKLLETLVVLSAISLSIKSPVAFAVFWIALFEAIWNGSVTDFLAWSRSSWLYLTLKILLAFLVMLLLIFLAKDKNI